MKKISYLFKWVFFGFGIVPVVYSLIVSTIEFNSKPPINPAFEYDSIHWTTFFSRYFWLTISYYSYFFFFGLLILEGVKAFMNAISGMKSIIIQLFVFYIYFFLFQLAALKITNLTTDYFHFGNITSKLVLLVLIASTLFSFLYYLLFNQNKDGTVAE
ncbi:hypothetical protein [Sediminibacterium sp.]|uniref:hypothetical protein n=1 Tax=Sediminibacterium sp. TaxID=1917865 RepID=UPI0025E481EB|nr:hypothetical protein [Sediminibacterium sp.]MBW0177401.1 hypothetical protein [Sediminibacterium sp.]